MRYKIGTGMVITPGARDLAQLLGRHVSRPLAGGGVSGVGCPCGGSGPVCRCGTSGFSEGATTGAGWAVGIVAALAVMGWVLSK